MNTVTEQRAIMLFNQEFGKDLHSRIAKLQEEVKELAEAIADNHIEHIKDEVSDVQAVLTHIQSIIGLNNQSCLEMAMDKVVKRKTNPEYKRFKNKMKNEN